MSYAVPSLQPIRDEIASEVAIINDEIDSEVVINAAWVNVYRSTDTEYENTTGRTYEVMMKTSSSEIYPTVRLIHPDGANVEVPCSGHLDLTFQLKPGESVKVEDPYTDVEINFWLERQL